MSALSIIVGGCLLLNAVVFAALMLRRDQPALRNRLFRWVVSDKVHDQLGDRAAIGTSTLEVERDVVGYVEGPALGGVESDDVQRLLALAIERVANHPRTVGVDHVGIGQVIEHEPN
jgi:hypothetical protein